MPFSIGDRKLSEVEVKTWIESIIDKAITAEEQRDTAWSELREIRTAIHADDNESTVDEVRRVIALLQKSLDEERQERDELAAQLATAQNALKAIIEASTYIDDGVNDAGDKQISRIYSIATNAMPANQVQP